MLREHAAAVSKLRMLLDVLVNSISFGIVFFMWNFTKVTVPCTINDLYFLLSAIVVVWGGVFHYRGMYSSFRFESILKQLRNIVFAV